MDVRAVPQHRYAGGPHPTDPDTRADALVAALVASALGLGPWNSISADVAALAERYVDVLRDAAYPPECVVIAIKDALRRAHHGRPRAPAMIPGVTERYDFDLISLGIRRLFVTREAPPRYSSVQGGQNVAAAMLRSAALIERAVAVVEQASRLTARAQLLRENVLLNRTAWSALELSVREVAHVFKRLAVDEEETILRVRALVHISVDRHADLPDHEHVTASATLWAHDVYASAA
jgi:hypothetical protein